MALINGSWLRRELAKPSTSGTFRTCRPPRRMSAFGGKADFGLASSDDANDPLRTFLTNAKNEFIDRTHERAVAVNQKQQKHLSEICRCGKVKLEAVGRPILTASCYCASCQEAGSRFEQLASAPSILNPDGGTDYVLYRKDRVQCVTGQE